LNTGVHALTTDRRMDVGGVARQEHISSAVMLSLTVVYVEGRHLVGRPDLDANSRTVDRMREVIDREITLSVVSLLLMESDDCPGGFI
jgi:hypothetical protein